MLIHAYCLLKCKQKHTHWNTPTFVLYLKVITVISKSSSVCQCVRGGAVSTVYNSAALSSKRGELYSVTT